MHKAYTKGTVELNTAYPSVKKSSEGYDVPGTQAVGT
jgi:hypothetical protein